MKPLQLGLSLLPVAIIVMGLIGWVVTLRGNLDVAQKDIAALQASQYDDTDLIEKVQDLSIASEDSMTKLMWILEEYGPAIESIRERELDTDVKDRIAELDREIGAIGSVLDRAKELGEIVNDVKTQIAVISNEQRTINADHQGFAEVLKELGESGLLPSGERREYGGYSN